MEFQVKNNHYIAQKKATYRPLLFRKIFPKQSTHQIINTKINPAWLTGIGYECTRFFSMHGSKQHGQEIEQLCLAAGKLTAQVANTAA